MLGLGDTSGGSAPDPSASRSLLIQTLCLPSSPRWSRQYPPCFSVRRHPGAPALLLCCDCPWVTQGLPQDSEFLGSSP